jgi:imidazolonepropionase-like amidohydrolase
MPAAQAHAIRAARLIDGTGAAPRSRPTLLIQGSRIIDMFADDQRLLPDGALITDVPNGTILPGLIDGHLHVAGLLAGVMFDADDPEASTDAFMRQLARNGVTSVRDTGSPDVDRTFRTMKQGRPTWPRFHGSGPNLDGVPGGPWSGLRAMSSAAEARQNVQALADAGVDFIKIYAWMGPELAQATIDEAHRLGLTVAAHVGHALTVSEALELGVDAFEHVRIGRELVPADRLDELFALPVRRHDAMVSFAPWRFIDPGSPAARELIGRLVDRGAFLTPTLCLSESILHPEASDSPSDPTAWESSEGVVAAWRAGRYTIDHGPTDRSWAPVELSRQLEFIGLAHEAGLRIVAGTDTPNPFIPPGTSLHRELRLLVAGGLSRLAAITAATGRAAELLGRTDELGTLEAGKAADVLVVDGDPTADLAALAQVRLVLKEGRPLHDDVDGHPGVDGSHVVATG